MKQTIRQFAEEILPDVLVIRRDIHAHPEVGMDTVRTAGVVAAELEKLGIPYRMVGNNGVIADIKG